MEIIVSVVLLVVIGVTGIAIWRFAMFRNSGGRALIRKLPAHGLHGWRHGILRYTGEELQFYKLRSLSSNYDYALDRRDLTINGVRDLTADEQEIMPGVSTVLEMTSPRGQLEFAADRHVEMALISWVESAPDRRQQRVDVRSLAQRVQRGRA
ncbi:DUF2550 family protein [Corynebacterium godavarianum]|uniref:DUF2550 family protein n=1 Tax=Corynebacterium godavarianum TaxID=2054421 RepID=A0ABY3E6X7_9CORY|nr:DUF2550 domain-containing protein [Corynebacterium godavarianum]MBL7285723.1 DUF2550 family protein [Corynebacterium godavarianum]TSJ75440.1 DUF2550 family protein [Corynebacterium godavarianum]